MPEEPRKSRVENFSYNGFYVTPKPGYALYTAEFIEWTSDPGVARCRCSDGEERLIPSYCLVDIKYSELPPQPRTGVLFGAASSS